MMISDIELERNGRSSQSTGQDRHTSGESRLRTGHICVGEHFSKMGWNISPLCKCGEGISSLAHYFNECSLFLSKRPRFRKFIRDRLRKDYFGINDWQDLIFQTDFEFVIEIGEFFAIEDLIV